MEAVNAITRLSRPSRQGFCAVYVGREKVATADIESIRRLGLSRGMPWTPALEREVLTSSAHARAKLDALRAVASRMLTRKQLVDRLARKRHDRTIAQQVADELVAKGLINDEAAAEMIASAAVARKPAGRRLIESKLAAKGVSRSTATAAAKRALAGHDLFEDALRLVRGKFARMSDRLTPDAKRRRLFGLLARRGFEPDVARQVIDRLMKPGDDA